ncbi:hypothetical protein FACS189487_05080 [Campylobacterota bacterium]|nr:hypothetical protein FACS189487_05080 [Campylobacterota bacterium]
MSVGSGARRKREDLSVKFDMYVSKLDDWINSRKPNELRIIALLIPLALLAGDYYYVVPPAQKKEAQSKATYDDTVAKIKAFTDGGGKEEVERLNAETVKIRENIIRMNQTDTYIQVQLTGIDHLYFSTLEWAQHLDFVTERAAERNIVLMVQENTVEETQVGFGPVMSVTIDGHGGFKSTLDYLFIVETGASITPIEELKMTVDERDRIAFTAKSVLWGLK